MFQRSLRIPRSFQTLSWRLRRVVIRMGAALFLLGLTTAAQAQRHSFGSSPPTPPSHSPQPIALPTFTAPPPGPVAPVSAGMGAIQFMTSNYVVPAPQTLTRQLSAEDERTRSGALSSLGAPGQYLGHGHVPFPHSVQLDLVQLSGGDELDALLTVELDQHIVSAVMVPDGDSWHKIATVTFANAFSSAGTTPATFARPLRSWLQPARYRVVFRGSVTGPTGDFTENEADLRVIKNRAVIVLDFVSGARQCDSAGQFRPAHQSCELIQRWLEPDPADPTHHFTLITGVGHFSAHEAIDPLSRSRNYRLTRLRAFACQPFVFSEAAQRFEPTANSVPCALHEPVHAGGPDRSDHPDHPDHS